MAPSLYASVRTKTSQQKACLQEQSRIGIFIWNTEAGFPRGSARNAAIQNWKQKIQRTWNKRKTILNLAANRKNKAIIKVCFWKIKTERTTSYMTYSCNSCSETWNRKEVQKEIQKATWTGAIFRPECYNTMKASFISCPELFKAWKAEHGFT